MKKETDGQRETVIEGKELNYTYPGTKTPVWEKNLTFTIDKGELPFKNKDYIFVPDVHKAVEDKLTKIPAYVVNEGMKEITLTLGELTDDEREIILKGCLINYYRD